MSPPCCFRYQIWFDTGSGNANSIFNYFVMYAVYFVTSTLLDRWFNFEFWSYLESVRVPAYTREWLNKVIKVGSSLGEIVRRLRLHLQDIIKVIISG